MSKKTLNILLVVVVIYIIFRCKINKALGIKQDVLGKLINSKPCPTASEETAKIITENVSDEEILEVQETLNEIVSKYSKENTTKPVEKPNVVNVNVIDDVNMTANYKNTTGGAWYSYVGVDSNTDLLNYIGVDEKSNNLNYSGCSTCETKVLNYSGEDQKRHYVLTDDFTFLPCLKYNKDTNTCEQTGNLVTIRAGEVVTSDEVTYTQNSGGYPIIVQRSEYKGQIINIPLNILSAPSRDMITKNKADNTNIGTKEGVHQDMSVDTPEIVSKVMTLSTINEIIENKIPKNTTDYTKARLSLDTINSYLEKKYQSFLNGEKVSNKLKKSIVAWYITDKYNTAKHLSKSKAKEFLSDSKKPLGKLISSIDGLSPVKEIWKGGYHEAVKNGTLAEDITREVGNLSLKMQGASDKLERENIRNQIKTQMLYLEPNKRLEVMKKFNLGAWGFVM